MIEYPRPNTSPGYRADEQECIDRAQRALEVAEVNLDTVANLLNSHNAAGRATLFSDLIAAAEARARVLVALDLIPAELAETGCGCDYVPDIGLQHRSWCVAEAAPC